jgi:hypothetical protein
MGSQTVSKFLSILDLTAVNKGRTNLIIFDLSRISMYHNKLPW